jgi:hypothetical protein
MDDLRTRALLVDFDPTRTGTGAIGTVITRDEIAETAARGEFPATLLLDLEAADGGEVTAHARVAVEWDEGTLDQLLASTEDNEIALWFDERELARAFDESEVEGHGLREKAAVVAIAVVAAGASATPAFARIPAETPDSGGAASTGFSVDTQAGHTGGVVQPAGAERGLLQDEQIAVQQTQSGVSEPAATSSGGGPSSGEIAAIAGGLGAVLISAAGFGVARKRMPPVHPA